MLIEVKNNGCAEVEYADLFGRIMIQPGTATIDVPAESIQPLIATMQRRAPFVFIKVVVDEPGPKPTQKQEVTPRKKPGRPRTKEPEIEEQPSFDGGE